jgi:hypothetical protein
MVVGVLARLAPAALLAVSIGGCNQTIDPRGGAVFTSVPAAGLFIEGDCVTRNITVADPVTGELKPIRQRFCGRRPISAADGDAAAALFQKASARRSSTRSSSAPAGDAQAAAKKNAASSSDAANSPPVQRAE